MKKKVAMLFVSLLHPCFSHAQVREDLQSAQRNDTSLPVRLKDLVEIRGVRSNPLVGVGLVVGLPGTGDSKQSLVTNKSIANLITRLGTRVDLKETTTKNVAAVVVTAELPPFARIGDKLSIRISSIGDSQSLEGGTLILTPLSAADSRVYAVAQGPISQGTAMSGAGGGGQNGGGAPKTVAVSNSASVEREFPVSFTQNGNLELSLRSADFTTASRIVKAINENYGAFLAQAVNSGLIKVSMPTNTYSNPSFSAVEFVAGLEQLKVEPDSRALVVLNERTGTIVAGADTVLAPVAISHGNLEISVEGKTTRMGALPKSATVGDLVRALGALGAGPKDFVSILQALEASHALKAELKIL
jgi:flagellar P-ring protein FlgI